jgi:apolipoprotein N-acyltransferase
LNNQAGKKPGSNIFSLPPAWADVAACVAGSLLPLAFSPFDLFPLAVLAPAVLFLLWREVSPVRAAWRGLLFGLGMFGVGVSWVYVSMHHYGNMPAPLAGLAVFLFVAGLSLYPALLGWLQARFFPKPGAWHPVVALPALWVLFEWTRGWFLTGFPWLHLGYSQVASPLAGYGAWLGVYGVSFFCALSAGLLVAGMRAPEKFLRLFLPLLVAVWVAGWFAGRFEWVRPVNSPLQVTLIQGNVPLDSKWQPGSRRAIMDRYSMLTAEAPWSDLIVWPESAIPATLDEVDPDLLANLRHRSRNASVDFLIGIVERDKDGNYYNSVLGIGPSSGIYRKQHLVPFGEYPPLDPLFRWLMRNLQIPMSDFSAGAPDQPPLVAAGQKIGMSVCYEDAFGEEVIRALPQASLLVNVSEDAWFGDSLAPHQRLQMARMRALETGRPMLRATNTGPSVAIDHRGRVLVRSPQFRTYSLTATVQPMQGTTPYVRWGNWPVVLVLVFVVVLAVLAPRLHKHPANMH